MATNFDVMIARYDGINNETVVEKPSADVVADISAMLEDQKKWQADFEAEMLAKKMQKELLLQKLGITEDEAKLLLS